VSDVAELWGGLFAAIEGQNREKGHRFDGRRGETVAKMGTPNWSFVRSKRATRSESQAKQGNAQKQKDEYGHCAYHNDRAASAAEVGVGCLDAAVLDPPANGHDRDGVLDEDEAHHTGESEERKEDQDSERNQDTQHDFQVAGVAAGLTNPAG
jgi:hypothetical protein